MNINTLQYFISAAELCSFTQAAKKHFVAPPAVSQQIAKMEQEIGVPLFIREKKRIVLTKAGQIFYKEMKKVVNDYEDGIEKTRRFYHDQKKALTIGYTRQMDIEILSEALVEYQQQNPEVEIIIKEDSTSNLMQEVKHGVCDLLLNMSVVLQEVEEAYFNKYTYYRGDMLLAVSTMHPKSKQDSLSAMDLKDEKFIVLNASGEEYGFAEMHAHCQQDGYELQVIDYATNLGALLFQVELNRGVAFVQDRMKNPNPERLKFIAIKNSAHKYGVDIVWHKFNEDSTLREFVSYLKKKVSEMSS